MQVPIRALPRAWVAYRDELINERYARSKRHPPFRELERPIIHPREATATSPRLLLPQDCNRLYYFAEAAETVY